MREGKDVRVRGEIQMDVDLCSDSKFSSLMLSQPSSLLLHCDEYNSCGGSDSEQDSSDHSKIPRSRHCKRPIKTRRDKHREQGDTRLETDRLCQYQICNEPRDISQSCQQESKGITQVSSKCRRKFKVSDRKKKRKMKSDLKQTKVFEEMKKDEWEMYKMKREESETEKRLKQKNVELVKDNKELYESSAEKADEIDKSSDMALNKDHKRYEHMVETTSVSRKKKSVKDSINEKKSLQKYAVENDQSEMLEKQKLNMGRDVKLSKEMDREMKATVESNELEEGIRRKKHEMKQREKNLQDEKNGKTERITEMLCQKEELFVNMEEARLKDAYKSILGLTPDNKYLDLFDKLKDDEQTGLKRTLDPQHCAEKETQDVSKEISVDFNESSLDETVSTLRGTQSSLFGIESTLVDTQSDLPDEGWFTGAKFSNVESVLSIIDKESLGFEVERQTDGTLGLESDLSYQNLKNVTKVWEQSHRECETSCSIEENSFHFSLDCQQSCDSLLGSASLEKKSWDTSYYSLSKESWNILNLFKQCSQPERKVLQEQNKTMILEKMKREKELQNVDVKQNEEKFKKDEQDKEEGGSENKEIDDASDVDDYEKTDDDEKMNDEERNDADDYAEETNQMVGTDQVRNSTDNDDQDDDDDTTDDDDADKSCESDEVTENNEELYEIIDAEEKDFDANEKTVADKTSIADADKSEDSKTVEDVPRHKNVEEQPDGVSDALEKVQVADETNVCIGDEEQPDGVCDTLEKVQVADETNVCIGDEEQPGGVCDTLEKVQVADETNVCIGDEERKDADSNDKKENRDAGVDADLLEKENTVANYDVKDIGDSGENCCTEQRGVPSMEKQKDIQDFQKRNLCKKLRKGRKEKTSLEKRPGTLVKRKIPEPVLQQNMESVAPGKNWKGRGYSVFENGKFGRRCSGYNGGNSGSGRNYNSSSGNSSSGQRNNGNKNGRNRRNQNDDSRDGDDHNKNNNNNSQSLNDSVFTGTDANNVDPPKATRGLEDVNKPAADFKAYRKKHTELENFEWLETCSSAVEENNGPVEDLFDKLKNGEYFCLAERLDHPEELSQDALQCSVCLTVDSLLKHNAHCLSVYNKCGMCVKIFSLICSHVATCASVNDSEDCEIRICKAIRVVTGRNVKSHMKTLWFLVRKKLARIIDDAEEDRVEQPMEQSVPLDDGRKRRVSRASASLSGPLPSIPECTALSLTSTSRSGSRVLRRKKSNLTDVDEQPQSEVSGEDGSSASEAVNAAVGAQGVEEETVEEVDSKHGLATYSRPEIPDEADALPTSSEEGSVSVESICSGSTEGSGHFVIMQGASRFASLPMGPPGHGETYFPSFKDKPTGKKGIGEVVYANKHQLVVVVTIWEKFKTQYLIEAKLAKHYTEEGVILADFKSKLHIKGLRYQNEFQWVKVAHLGNGMNGKCHLATDFETDFKFCVKEIHISNYEKEEIELWSELDHPYVVQVYGAIRHGEKIYILQEFIEGGCLTEAINIQRKLGRRLSQLVALRFFQQLLQVLRYLKTRNILHEDLKADNILLNKTSEGVSIKVADFGLARRSQGLVRSGTKPVGTQTQWSPEKAEAVGYGFPAEVWAAVCVLVHMLAGLPPWIRRYENFKTLIVVIVGKSPPLEDIPRNIHESIKDLIRRGFTVCQGQRPTAENLLSHGAFRLLEEAPILLSTSRTYSILESVHLESPTNRIDDDPNADLREIARNLERASAAGNTVENDKARRKDQRLASVVDLHGEEVPYYSNDYRVYDEGKNDKTTETLQSAVGQTTDDSKRHRSQAEAILSVGHSGIPSRPDQNLDPSGHIFQFYNDSVDPAVAPPAPPNLVVYHPNLESIGSQKENSGSAASSLENISSGTVTGKLIPDFNKLYTSDEVYDTADDEEKEEDILADFNFEKGVEMVRKSYNLPTVLNSSAGMSPGSQLSSEQESTSPGIPMEENAVYQKNDTLRGNSVPQTVSETQKFESKTSFTSSCSTHGGDQLPSITDDDLFRSGSPPKLNLESSTHLYGEGNVSTLQGIPEHPSRMLMHEREYFQGVNGTGRYRVSNGTLGLVGVSLPPVLENVHTPNRPLTCPYTAPTQSMQNYAVSPSSMHQSLGTGTVLNAPVYHKFASPGQRQTDQNSRYQRPERYTHQHHYEQEQNWLQPHQFGQQRMTSQYQQQQTQLPGTFQQQYGTQRQPVNSPLSPGMQNRPYSLSPNREVTRQQFNQHVQGQIRNLGQGQVQYRQPPASFQGGNVPYSTAKQQGMPEYNQLLQRSEFQQEVILPTEQVNFQYASQHGLISMPNQLGRQQYSAGDPMSLSTQRLSPYQARAPRSDEHYGARPKVPLQQQQQQPRLFFPSSESQPFTYGRRNVQPMSVKQRIQDPRIIYEQAITRTGREGQNPGYPVQPKTPILNPVINPRPPAPQEGQRLDLRLDINKAQQAPEVAVSNLTQTAPVFSPPKTPRKSPDLQRALSQVPMVSRSMSQFGISSISSKDDKMSSSASKSQFEEQDDAFRELWHTAEEALSQHSDSAHKIFYTERDDDFDEITGELHVDDSILENPAQSLAHVLDPVQDDSVKVTFRSDVNGHEFSMKFPPKHTSKTWEKIITEELDGFSGVNIKDFGLQRFCLKCQNDCPVDLDCCLGKKSITVIMVEAKDNDPWWIEGGMISR